MKTKYVSCLIALLVSAGCATFVTNQQDISKKLKDGTEQREISTKAKATTLFTSKSALTKFKANQTDKSQGATVGSLEQESSGTNAVEALKHLDSILGKVR